MTGRVALGFVISFSLLWSQVRPVALEGAEAIGATVPGSRIGAYRKGNTYLLSVAPGVLKKPFLWYSELVGVRAGAVSDSLEA